MNGHYHINRRSISLNEGAGPINLFFGYGYREFRFMFRIFFFGRVWVYVVKNRKERTA